MSNKIPYNFTGIPNFLIESGWVKDHKTLALFLHLFYRIRYEPHIEFIEGKEVVLDAFEFVFGRDSVSQEVGLTSREIRTRIKQITTSKMAIKVTSKTTSKYTVYRWVKEHFMKKVDQQNDQQSDQQNDIETTSTATTKKNEDANISKSYMKDEKTFVRHGGNVHNSQAHYEHSPHALISPFTQITASPEKQTSSLSSENASDIERLFVRVASFRLMDGTPLKNESIQKWSSKHTTQDLLVILDWFDDMQNKKFKSGEILGEAYLQDGITQGWWKVWNTRKISKEIDKKQAQKHRRNE
jgi:hypothetical protein